MQWYLKVMKQYADFNGRARRMEYWMFILFNFLFLILAMVIDNVVLGKVTGGLPIMYMLYALGTFIPGLAVAIRRLHDTGKSGWWFLIAFIPLGGLVLLVFFVQEGERGSNQYGPDPLGRRGRGRDDDRRGGRGYDDYDDEGDDRRRGRREDDEYEDDRRRDRRDDDDDYDDRRRDRRDRRDRD